MRGWKKYTRHVFPHFVVQVSGRSVNTGLFLYPPLPRFLPSLFFLNESDAALPKLTGGLVVVLTHPQEILPHTILQNIKMALEDKIHPPLGFELPTIREGSHRAH